MAKHSFSRDRGFSIVEMLVAVVFTSILMVGMAGVFKANLSTFTATGEKIASMRRNRSATDIMYEDLNSAGMFLTDLNAPPNNLSANNPAFYILPNQAVVGYVVDGKQQYADQLFFYMDQPLGFEGTLTSTNAKSASELVYGATALSAPDTTFVLDCVSPDYAKQLVDTLAKGGVSFLFKDIWGDAKTVQTATRAGSQVTVVIGPSTASDITGVGSYASQAEKARHSPTSGIVFFQPAQMVRYSIQMVSLDPQSDVGIPCLVRDQTAYSPAGFAVVTGALAPQVQVITENVQNFRVYLSANSGTTWAPTTATTATYGNNPDFATGWTSGIQADLNTQLAAAGRKDFQTTSGNLSWFRSIPAVVRLDITTQTANKRTEYSTTATPKLDYKTITQSLVLVPRHFGLRM